MQKNYFVKKGLPWHIALIPGQILTSVATDSSDSDFFLPFFFGGIHE